jgi:hypothetical protein
VETIENPANAAVSAAVNVQAARTAQRSTAEGQMPALEGGAFGFFTTQSEALEHSGQLIEQAFVARADTLARLTDEQWLQFDVAAQERAYRQLLDDMSPYSGVEALREPEDLARVLERHLWALWIKGQREAQLIGARQTDEALRRHPQGGGPGPIFETAARARPELSLGTDIERRLNALGISGLARVRLSGTWYSSNSPGDWQQLLLAWANTYRDSIRRN